MADLLQCLFKGGAKDEHPSYEAAKGRDYLLDDDALAWQLDFIKHLG